MRVYHLRDKELPHSGAVTLAIVKEGDSAVVGVSVCSPKDQFNRKKGRAIATGRVEAFHKTPRRLHKNQFVFYGDIGDVINNVVDSIPDELFHLLPQVGGTLFHEFDES